jgi:hypothetical protein
VSDIDHHLVLKIISGLMTSGNLGDVHDQINFLHDLIGIPRPEGDFLGGWTDQDWRNIGREPGSDE